MEAEQNLELKLWKEELEVLVASAKDEGELAALEAFQKAMSPHFDDPGALRTLLGKITMSLFSLDPNLGVQNFASLEELKAALPAYVEFVAA